MRGAAARWPGLALPGLCEAAARRRRLPHPRAAAPPPPVRAGVQVIFYVLFGQAQMAFTFLLSAFFSSSRTAVVAAYV